MTDPADDPLVDRARVLRRGAALLLRYVAQRLDRRDVLSEHVQALVNVHTKLIELPRLLVQQLAYALAPTGTVLVLWEGGCISRTFDLPRETDVGRDCLIEAYRPIPEGAWIVAHQCVLRQVHVGAESHDLGPVPRGKLVRLRVPVGVGDRLQLEVRSEFSQRGDR